MKAKSSPPLAAKNKMGITTHHHCVRILLPGNDSPPPTLLLLTAPSADVVHTAHRRCIQVGAVADRHHRHLRHHC